MTILAHSLARSLLLARPRSPNSIYTHRIFIVAFGQWLWVFAYTIHEYMCAPHHMHETQCAHFARFLKTTFFTVCESEIENASLCMYVCVCVFSFWLNYIMSKWAFKEQKLRKITWFFSIRLNYIQYLPLFLFLAFSISMAHIYSLSKLLFFSPYSVFYIAVFGLALHWIGDFVYMKKLEKRIMWNKSGGSGNAMPMCRICIASQPSIRQTRRGWERASEEKVQKKNYWNDKK